MKHRSKLLTLIAALMGCVLAFAQDQPKRAPEARYTFTVFRTRDGFRIEAFDQRVLVTFTTYQGECRWKNSSVRPNSDEADVPSGVLRLKGNVEVTTGDTVLQADEADYHCATGEIEPLTNVRFRYTPQ